MYEEVVELEKFDEDTLAVLHNPDKSSQTEICYQDSLFGSENTACLSDQFSYNFSQDHYPSRPPYYSGRYKFQKHYFPQSLI